MKPDKATVNVRPAAPKAVARRGAVPRFFLSLFALAFIVTGVGLWFFFQSARDAANHAKGMDAPGGAAAVSPAANSTEESGSTPVSFQDTDSGGLATNGSGDPRHPPEEEQAATDTKATALSTAGHPHAQARAPDKVPPTLLPASPPLSSNQVGQRNAPMPWWVIAIAVAGLMGSVLVAIYQVQNGRKFVERILVIQERLKSVEQKLDDSPVLRKVEKETADRAASLEGIRKAIGQLEKRLEQVASKGPAGSVAAKEPLRVVPSRPPVPPLRPSPALPVFDIAKAESDVLDVAKKCLAMSKTAAQADDILRSYPVLALAQHQVDRSELPNLFVVSAGEFLFAIPNTAIWRDLAPYNVFETEGQKGPGASVEEVLAPARVEFSSDGSLMVEGSRFGRVRVRM